MGTRTRGFANKVTADGVSSLDSTVITGATAETTIAGGDQILIYDDSATALRKMTRTNFVSGLGGLSEADVMKVTGNQNINSGVYTTITPFTMSPEATHSKIGTGMTESSGIFTFPSTGIYLVFLNSSFSYNVDVTYTIHQIQVTTNNSTYSTVAESNFSLKVVSGQTYYTTTNFCFFDVQSTANYKIRFQVYGTHAFRMDGDTKLYFLKLAET